MQDVQNDLRWKKPFNWDELMASTYLWSDELPEVAHLDADELEWKAGWNQYLMTAGLLVDTDFAGLEKETCGPELIIL